MYVDKKYDNQEMELKMEFYESTIASKHIFSGNIIKLRVDEVLLPNGRKSTREIVEHPGAVAIVAITDDDEVLMVRQYRKAVERELLEIPAGKLEKGESKEECVKRELMEETGYYPNELKYLLSFYTSPGFSDEIIHLFLGKKLIKEAKDADFDEYIQAEKVPFKEALNKIKSREIVDSKTITGLLLASLELQGGL